MSTNTSTPINPFRARLTDADRTALDSIRASTIARFGNDAMRMEDAPAAPVTPAAPAVPGAPVPAPPVTAPVVAPVAPPANPAEDVASLPSWAQTLIGGLRTERGAERATAKETAAAEARAEVAQTIGKALGLIKADGADAPTPEALAAAVKTAAVENLVLRQSPALGANADALLDSRAFAASLAEVDPAAADAAAVIKTKIEAALAATPSLKAAPAATAGGSPMPGSIPAPSGEATLPGTARMASAYGTPA